VKGKGKGKGERKGVKVRDQSQGKGGRKEILYCRRRPMIPKDWGGGGDPRVNPTAQHSTVLKTTVNPATQSKPRSDRGEETQKKSSFSGGCWLLDTESVDW